MRIFRFTHTFKDFGLEDEFEFWADSKVALEEFQFRTRKVINNRNITEDILKLSLKDLSNTFGNQLTIQTINGLNFQIKWKFNDSFHDDKIVLNNGYIVKSLRGRTRTTKRFSENQSIPSLLTWDWDVELDLFSC